MRAIRGRRFDRRKFDFEGAHDRLRSYRSRLSHLSAVERGAVFMDVGPEVAGIPDASEIGERMTNRATEIDLIQDAEQRHEGYAREWLADPEFKAAVHRDRKSTRLNSSH